MIHNHPKIEQYGYRDVHPNEYSKVEEFQISFWVKVVLFLSGSAVFAAIFFAR